MIHQYKLNGYNIVLDVNSGAVHVVDDVAYDIIAAYETTPRAEIVRQMMTKYVNREDVNEAEIAQCIDDVEALAMRGSSSLKTGSAMRSSTSRKTTPASRPSACMLPIPATSIAPIALPVRANITATGH